MTVLIRRVQVENDSALAIGVFRFASAQPEDALQTLLDRAEIEELVARYVHTLDTRDADGYAAVFTKDAVYETPIATYSGHDEIRTVVTSMIDMREASLVNGEQPADLYHVMSNSSIEILSSTEARHISYAQTVRAGEGGQFMIGFMGRYEDEIVKRDGRWQIANRKLVSFVR